MAAWCEVGLEHGAQGDPGTGAAGSAETLQPATPDPKPRKRQRASRQVWEIIHQHFEFHPCVHCGVRHESLHHILPKSQGGDDVIPNLAPLCGDGTRGCHGLLESHGPGWERVAASVRQFVMVDPTRRNYQEERAGEAFYTRYPPLPNTDPRFEQDFRTIYPPREELPHEL